MQPQYFVITAAGGNATAIEVINAPRPRHDYESAGHHMMGKFGKEFDVEQTGSLVFSNEKEILHHFEMSGGEFCGNAARAAGLVLANITHGSNQRFTMSATVAPVDAYVQNDYVTCVFRGMKMAIKKCAVPPFGDVTVVDLGGIVHVLIEGDFPVEGYRESHKRLVDSLGLCKRPAVGVIWFSRATNHVSIAPVVWVRAVDTLYQESSCGSGSIAMVASMGKDSLAVTQPSGCDIQVDISPDSIQLASVMKVVCHV